jgi:hypothetical protein
MQGLKCKILFTGYCLLFIACSYAADPPYLKDTSNAWVDSLLKNMTLDEKIGPVVYGGRLFQ